MCAHVGSEFVVLDEWRDSRICMRAPNARSKTGLSTGHRIVDRSDRMAVGILCRPLDFSGATFMLRCLVYVIIMFIMFH